LISESTIFKTFEKKQAKVPVWLMRQAGRYLPEYQQLKKKAGSFWNLCLSPSLATEATIQPVKRFGLDAAIIFSDILVIPAAMGIEVTFVNDKPAIQYINTISDIKYYKHNISKYLEPTYEAISNVRSILDKTISVIGFIGGPWTLANYILSSNISCNKINIKELAYNKNIDFIELIDNISDYLILHIINQVKNGADIIQIFDTQIKFLSEDIYKEFVIKPAQKIIKSVKKEIGNVKFIGYPRGSNIEEYYEYSKNTGIDAISVDESICINSIKNNFNFITIQGNLDPTILLMGGNLLKMKTLNILNSVNNTRFIFNLGNGVLPETPVENIEYLVDIIRGYK
jgi:uroporphyrinogen decarboxylase